MSGEPHWVNYLQSPLVPLNEFQNLVTDHLAILIEAEPNPSVRTAPVHLGRHGRNIRHVATDDCSLTIFASLSPQLKHTPSTLRALCPRAHLLSSPYPPVHLRTSEPVGFLITPYAKDAPPAFSPPGPSVSTQPTVLPTSFEVSTPYTTHNSIFFCQHKHHGASANQVNHPSMVGCSNL
jgi:hypothetical protein